MSEPAEPLAAEPAPSLESLESLELLGSAALLAARRGEPARLNGRPTAAAAFYAARDRYMSGQRIDMRALAAELGVSRPTLYRWTHGREQLLSDVLFFLSDELFVHAQRQAAGRVGIDRLIAVFRSHVSGFLDARPLHMFLKQETHAALRILTARDSSVQIRTVARLAEFYREEQRAGTFAPGVDIDTLAYAVVRITEAFIYNDAIIAVEPELERASAIVELLLRGASKA